MLQPDDIIRLERDAVVLLDQTLLPLTRQERRCTTVAELVLAIRELAVRGAPLLGVAGAMGVALAAAASGAADPEAGHSAVRRAAAALADARPTAVNLVWGVAAALGAFEDAPAGEGAAAAADCARRVHRDEVARCRAMGAHGAGLFGPGARILTQCNAGALATGGYGSALGVVRALAERGVGPHVWVPETRPLQQGSRLTAWELAEDGISHAVLCDTAVASLFGRGLVDGVVVGADRIAANGDAANKVGTYGLAMMAAHHDVPLYVVAPSTTIDPSACDGAAIPIEERDPDEVGALAGRRTAPPASPCINPAFDVTPAALVTAIVTEAAVHTGPYAFSQEVVPR